ncbi:hypothetical protein PRUPE_8G128700 [Prunus persica]|uniref:Cytochrome P450 n=1 Tax=Prunus persica TaxID=3760 RepID=A0A251MZD4_PRUPE|nr:cytochrome P450 94A1 [Prunus persica]ONH91669.1 hypothetical protein PRUPE_8G128700 [Prunus persica]
MFLQLLTLASLVLLPLLFFFVFRASSQPNPKTSNNTKVLKSYPIIGSFITLYKNHERRLPWFTDLLRSSPSNTLTIHHSLGKHFVVTGNPTVVQHILKTHFPIYEKGNTFRTTLTDLLGDGIFNADGDNWKFQRQVSSHEFNTKSLRKFVEQVVDTELSDRLIPILSAAATNNLILDFQDILQRFAFDNICRIAFGYDPAYLLPTLPEAKFAVAFDDAVQISGDRFSSFSQVWKLKRFLGIGSEKRLRAAVSEVREFANTIVREKKRELSEKKALESVDLLSRFLGSGHSDEKFVTDIVISFTLAGRDTTSAALTWFFWLLSQNPHVEDEILKEISRTTELESATGGYDEVMEMVYTHAALCESMRLYPPVPGNSKKAMKDDVLPDGTKVKKGMVVTYNVYSMGRMEEIWGEDWAEYRPERWLEEREENGAHKWKFVGRDSFSYPVFQAGPRICLGKEMAFLQMKRVVSAVLKSFKLVPVEREGGAQPEFVAYLTGKMKGGFPVTIVERA